MLGYLFKKEALIDTDVKNWIYDVFSWARHNFDEEVFQQTQLINPSNAHFPGRANSIEEMATMIFDNVRQYAGMNHWPLTLVNEENVAQIPPAPKPQLPGPLRSFDTVAPVPVEDSNRLMVSYHPYHINEPEVLIASYAHTLAHYLGTTANEPPPGGEEHWPHVTELLGVFLGFGIMMANTAHTNKIRSCGSCAGPVVERMNFLDEFQITYALAVFCQLKQLPAKKVTPYLKKNLVPFYKKAVKDN